MKELTIRIGEKLPKKGELREFEKKYKIKLPVSFAEFLLKQNPVYTEECYFFAHGRTFGIGFMPFVKGGKGSAIQKAMEIHFVSFFDKKYIPFGMDSGGWLFVISVQKVDYGLVYFARTDSELTEALTLLAADFDDFIDNLKSEY